MQITSKNFGNLVVTMVRFHLFPVAMTTAAAAGGLGRGGGMAWLAKFWPAMQGGPLRGIRVHELGAEGDTGPPPSETAREYQFLSSSTHFSLP